MIRQALTALGLMVIFSACQPQDDTDTPRLLETRLGDELHDVATDSVDTEQAWFHFDSSENGIEGISRTKAFRDLILTHEKEIVVAVLDTGVDITHPDLQGQIWVNPGESGLDDSGQDKAKNKIDDDKNGYVDDIHGWNFLGSADGKHATYESTELTREVARYEKKIANGDTLTEPEQKYYKKLKKWHDDEVSMYSEELKNLEEQAVKITAAKDVLNAKHGLVDFSPEAIKAIESTDPEVIKAQKTLLDAIQMFRGLARFERTLTTFRDMLQYHLNKNFNGREIVGDNPDDFTQVQYGNNDVYGPIAFHGTHVAGLIAARSGNNLGLDGVAKNVKIMVLKMVPNGDERDKDVALAVRYAVRNGAHIINMSFGKTLSTHKEKVDEAFLEAAKNGVLIFHSAGNNARDNDITPLFPNRHIQNATILNQPHDISTWIEVAASGRKKGLSLVGNFSNFGKNEVDLFSPGVEVLSTIPGGQYMAMSGTSMAAPIAAGVGALLLSNYPKLNAQQAKEIILSTVSTYPGLEVTQPGSVFRTKLFSELSATGGIVNAYACLKKAASF